MKDSYDVIVVGGGPGGATAATLSAMAGRSVLLVDKARFPRDKTCGDGISGKSRKILEELGVIDDIELVPHATMNGVIFSSPNGKILEVASPDGVSPAGYVARREVFDNVLFQRAKKYCDVVEEFTFTGMIKEGEQVVGIEGTQKGSTEVKRIRAKIVVGADGALSPVAKALNLWESDPKHVLVAIRAYYEGVSGMKDMIELHFVNEAIPGYFWIFPVDGGKANIGIGMVMDDFQKKYKGKRLDQLMFDIIQNNALFKERFANAKMVQGTLKGWNLPVGSKYRKLHADGAILIGDAAGLIDPFSGEGIGNAMASARMAAAVIAKAFAANVFSAKVLKEYEQQVYKELGSELKISYKMQRLGRHKFLVNMAIDKAVKKKELQDLIAMSLLKPEAKEMFASPLFYIKMLF